MYNTYIFCILECYQLRLTIKRAIIMRTKLYHKSFEYNENYDFETLGTNGISVKAERIVCPTCNGEGHHFRRDLDENAMVNEIREDYDEDSMRAYMSGAFDEKCTECHGRNVIDDVDWSSVPKWAKDIITEWDEMEAMDEKVRFAENGYRY